MSDRVARLAKIAAGTRASTVSMRGDGFGSRTMAPSRLP
jgi:hypothetical protein